MTIGGYCLLFLVAVATTGTSGGSNCVYKYNGHTIDLSKYLSFPISTPDVTDNKFSYNVDLCKSVNCNDDHTDGCACQLGGKKSGEAYKFSLGEVSTAEWKVKSINPLHFTVTYTKGDVSKPKDKNVARSAVFEFQYSDGSTKDEIKMTSQDSTNLIYSFSVSGGNITVVKGGGGGGGGGGSVVGYIGLVIIILAIVAVITYFIIGGVYMYNIRGARGAEVVPNLNFWTEVPILVKDGFVFTFGPLVRMARRGNSYDRI